MDKFTPIPSYLKYDPNTSTVKIIHAKTGVHLLTLKLEANSTSTMERVWDEKPGTVDCDNFWMGVKPADSVVFEDMLFDRNDLVVQSINFTINKK